MDLSLCQQLTQIPDVSGAPNIRDLKLEGCTNLKEIQDSVGGLTKVFDLSLEECTSLEIFPHGIQMTSLRLLNFNDCRSLQHFPDILEQMDKLKRFEARRTGIKQIPHSICYLPGLEVLLLPHNDNLVSIPESVNKLDRLEFFNLDNCRMLQQITGIPSNLQQLQADGCISLTSQSSNALWTQALQEVKGFSIKMPITPIPDWFDHRCKGGSLSFWVRRKFPFFAFAVVLGESTSETSSKFGGAGVKILCYNNGHRIWSNTSFYVSNGSGVFIKGLPDHLTIMQFNSCDWNLVEIKCSCCWSLGYKIDECGVYVYRQDINMEDIQFECPVPSNSNGYSNVKG